MRKELARKVKYEHLLSLTEKDRQLAVTNNDFSLIYGIKDVVFVVFTEQRPQVRPQVQIQVQNLG